MPFYTELGLETIRQRVQTAWKRLEDCDLCPRNCRVDRVHGQTGFCKAGTKPRMSSLFPHHGEEPALSGSRGSGTIFFSYCTLRCTFCQNHQISHEGHGREMTVEELAEEMLVLQQRRCHNINLVTPTHFVPQILKALAIAVPKGLNIPIVYNTSGYECLSTLQLLDGIVDVYLPDIKYADNQYAKQLSSCKDYVKHNRTALKEMWRQVGPLVADNQGIARQGMIVRHLVLPEDRAGTEDSMKWLAKEIGTEVSVSLMAQYSPQYRACECRAMARRIHEEEWFSAVEAFNRAGLLEGWVQDWQGMDGAYIIDFLKRKRERLK